MANNRPAPAKPENKHLIHGYVFGECSRYMLRMHVSQREGIPGCWMVQDAEILCPLTGLPEIIRQEDTPEAAVAGLDVKR